MRSLKCITQSSHPAEAMAAVICSKEMADRENKETNTNEKSIPFESDDI